MGEEKKADYYNRAFKEMAGKYSEHYLSSEYYSLWCSLVNQIGRIHKRMILEIGCGPGQFALMLSDTGVKKYTGFDFSSEAVCMAQRLNEGNANRFFVGDATDPESYKHSYDIIIATEVFEHIENEETIFCNIEAGMEVLFTVPTFDAPAHARYFLSESAVDYRFSEWLEDLKVVQFGAYFIGHGRRKN